MSQELFSLNADLKHLREEGYFTQVRGGLLLVHKVPYVNAKKEVRLGTLISSLTLAGNLTKQPDTHVVHFDGEYPCAADGSEIGQIRHQSAVTDMGHGVVSRHSFSSKPDAGYKDYHHKMTTYASILSGPAAVINPSSNPRVFATPDDDDGPCVFNYLETASDRVGIGALTQRLAGERLAIIGAGGTGSYVIDLTAKTPAQEIRLFDGGVYLQHNAFRAPGAPSLNQLRDGMKKVHYFNEIYGRMHRGITAHDVHLGAKNLDLLDGVTFAFICIDGGEAKRLIVERLHQMNVPFIDVGMGLELVDGSLGGILRVTVSTDVKRDHIPARVPFDGGGQDDLYGSNIQVADLNALNAVLAVTKWKKIRGFYRDTEREHHMTFTTDSNMLLSEDLA